MSLKAWLVFGFLAGWFGGPAWAAADGAWFHCQGSPALKADTNMVAVNKIMALPPSAAFYKLALTRLASLLAADFGLPTNSASSLAPLVGSVFETEAAGNFDGAEGKPPAFLLTLKLDEAGAKAWQTNLAAAFGKAGEKFTMDGFDGIRWDLAQGGPIWIVPARGWLLTGRGDEFSAVQSAYLQAIKNKMRPFPSLTNQWLQAELDAMRLRPWLPEWLRLVKPGKIKINVKLEKNFFHETAQVTYSEDVQWTAHEWKTPTNFLRGPLMSFATGQDIEAYLDLPGDFSRIWSSLLTNQFFAWSASEMPLQNYVAWPATDPTNTLEKIGEDAPAAFNSDLKRINGGQLQWRSDDKRLTTANLGMMGPALDIAQDCGRQYLLLNMFPVTPREDPVPNELLKQFTSHTNLVFYNWELTGPRLQEWRLLSQSLLEFPGPRTPEMNMARKVQGRWLGSLRPLVGNSITEVTRVSPREISITRNSPVGMTAFEILLFSDWLSGAKPAASVN